MKFVEINVARFNPEKIENFVNPKDFAINSRFQMNLNFIVSEMENKNETFHSVIKAIRALDGDDLKERLVSSLVEGVLKDL